MVRLRQRQRFRFGSQEDAGPETATGEATSEGHRNVEFRRTDTLRGARVTSRSTIWLVVLLAIVLFAMVMLR